MNGLANLAWAVMVTAGAFCLLVTIIADRAEIGRRFNQGAHLLSEAGPLFVAAALSWACRGRSPSRAAAVAANPQHPAVRPPGLPLDGRPLDGYEQERLDAIRRKFTWHDESEPRIPQQRGHQ